MDVGTTLRTAREQRGLSLEQVARATKIRASTLRAIEENQMYKLPGGIFTRGFLRAYAREVGVDGEDTVRAYLAEFEPPQVAAPPPVEDKWAEASSEDLRNRVNGEGVSASVRMLLFGVVIAIGLVGYNAIKGWAEESIAALIVSEPPPVPASVPPPASRKPDTPAAAVATSGSDANSAQAPETPPAASSAPVYVEIRTTGLCWVAVWSDGTSTFARLLPEGERHLFEAQKELVLRVGDAAALVYSVNGATGRSLGGSGQPVTVRINTDNHAEFVSP